MGNVFEGIKQGLEEAIAFSEGRLEAKTKKIRIEPVPTWEPQKVKLLRNELHLSQSIFGNVLGVSKKTVEAWEAGKNTPCGSASRLMEVISKEKDILARAHILVTK